MQGEEFGAWARRDSVGSALIVAEFDEDGLIVKQLGYSANLPAHKLLRRKILQQCHYVEKRWPFLGTFCLSHQSTQQVTKVGTLSLVRTIQIVLTTALLSCRLIVASRRQ
jgi:hypothetical protein